MSSFTPADFNFTESDIWLNAHCYDRYLVPLITAEVIADLTERGLKECEDRKVRNHIKRVQSDMSRVFKMCGMRDLGSERALRRTVSKASYQLIAANTSVARGLSETCDPKTTAGLETMAAAYESVTSEMARLGIEWLV